MKIIFLDEESYSIEVLEETDVYGKFSIVFGTEWELYFFFVVNGTSGTWTETGNWINPGTSMLSKLMIKLIVQWLINLFLETKNSDNEKTKTKGMFKWKIWKNISINQFLFSNISETITQAPKVESNTANNAKNQDHQNGSFHEEGSYKEEGGFKEQGSYKETGNWNQGGSKGTMIRKIALKS